MTRTVLLVFGGESSEHAVSINSARTVYQAIDTKKYDVVLCYIDTSGRWWLLGEWLDDPTKHSNIQLVAAPGTRHFLTVPGSNMIAVDVLFPVLHGKNGEDGSIQGLAQLMHIPIVGCGIEASALCMDKLRTKRLIGGGNVSKTANWISFEDAASFRDTLKSLHKSDHTGYSALTERLGDGPWFVKPSRAGSSVGVSKVETVEKLESAIEEAFKHDRTVLVEEAIEGRELEVAVLGNPPLHQVSEVGEIFPGDSFYSYDDKYADSSTSSTSLRAELPKQLRNEIRGQAAAIYEALDCRGLARVDFFLTPHQDIYLNEVNTLPGFTTISMYPKLWQDQGMSHSELVDRLIELSLE